MLEKKSMAIGTPLMLGWGREQGWLAVVNWWCNACLTFYRKGENDAISCSHAEKETL